ncbi:MAG: PAS domain-containing protein, partial [Candidatus Paceibacterota bacterium]
MKTKRQLIIENEQLHSRLVEIEDVLTAIRNGEVDAIMVSGKKGEQVYSVSTAETPYRTFIEEMGEGAVTLTRKGLILYCNPKFTQIVQTPYEKVVGSTLKEFIDPKDNSKLENFLAQPTHKKHDVLIVTLNNTLYLRLSIHLMPAYLKGDNYLLIATDISDLKKNEYDLNKMIGKLVQFIHNLRALRIENINEKLDTLGQNNKLTIVNDKLFKEIEKLNSLIEELKRNQ